MSQKQTPKVPSWFIPNHNPSNNNNGKEKTNGYSPTKNRTPRKVHTTGRKKERKKDKRAKNFFYHIRSAKSVPAIEFDVDEEADENPRPVE